MKKILCLLMSIIFVMAFITPSVFAEGAQTDKKNTSETISGAINFTCIYDVTTKKVIIDGTVSHDFLIGHEDYKIKVYSIAPGSTYQATISDPSVEPLADSNMTVKFTFSIETQDILDRYSMYTIVLVSPENEVFRAGEPMLPSVSSNFEYNANSREDYKGVLTSSPVDIGASCAGTVVVDVDVSKTLGDAADSILYPMNDAYINIRKSYIASIDKQIMSATLGGSNVYIRLLLSVNDEKLSQIYAQDDSRYTVPALHTEYGLEYVFTVSQFLARRYNGEKNGEISGMILGTSIDDVNVNAVNGMSTDQYAELYTLYLVVVGNAIRVENSELDIVIPLSDRNDYSSNAYVNDAIRPSRLLEQIIYRLDRNVSGTFDCSLLIESGHTPLTFDRDAEQKLSVTLDSTKITADNISDFVTYLNNIRVRFQSVPDNVIFLWTPQEELSGNLLNASYIYNYIKLWSNKFVSSFTVVTDKDKFAELESIIKYIDTEDANKRIGDIAKYYGYDSWETIINSELMLPVTHMVSEQQLLTGKPSDRVGEFQYMDFTSTSVYSLMNTGHNCSYIRSDYNVVGERVLSMVTGNMKIGDTAEAIGVFEYPESYEYTKYLSLKLGVSDKGADDGALYRVVMTLGNGKDQISASGVIKNKETTELFFDVSSFAANNMAKYIKISISCLTQDTNGCSVMLSEMCGYSTEYNSEALSDLITAKRAELRGENISDDREFNFMLLWTAIGIVFVLALTAVGLVVLFKRDER